MKQYFLLLASLSLSIIGYPQSDTLQFQHRAIIHVNDSLTIDIVEDTARGFYRCEGCPDLRRYIMKWNSKGQEYPVLQMSFDELGNVEIFEEQQPYGVSMVYAPPGKLSVIFYPHKNRIKGGRVKNQKASR